MTIHMILYTRGNIDELYVSRKEEEEDWQPLRFAKIQFDDPKNSQKRPKKTKCSNQWQQCHHKDNLENKN